MGRGGILQEEVEAAAGDADEDISSLVKMQLSERSGWNITSYSVTGYGGTEECYSMPGQALWVMWPDYDTVNVAKDLIAQVMAGQTPVIPED